jgi:hypothetical protein
MTRKAKPRTKKAVAMAKAADYRKRADECVEIARTARTKSQRTMLLHIAETWLRLAAEAEASPTLKSDRKPHAASAM